MKRFIRFIIVMYGMLVISIATANARSIGISEGTFLLISWIWFNTLIVMIAGSLYTNKK